MSELSESVGHWLESTAELELLGVGETPTHLVTEVFRVSVESRGDTQVFSLYSRLWNSQ